MRRQYLCFRVPRPFVNAGILFAVFFSLLTTRLQATASPASPLTNFLQNGDFESPSDLGPWRWSSVGGAEATGELDTTNVRSGLNAFKITNATPRSPNVYAALRQIVQDLKPNTAYQIRLWVKGVDVSGATLICGPRWDKRTQFPQGTYDWRYIVFDLTTDADARNFNIIISADSTVGTLWVDDIQLVEISEVERIEGPIVKTGLRNGGFDQPGLIAWDWALSGNPPPQASGSLDTSVKRSGNHSFKITNSTPESRNTYGRLRQLVDGLVVGEKYRLRMWIKGQSVSKCVLALGEGWKKRKNIPNRTYDWQEFTFDFEADRNSGFQIVLIAAGPTESLWVDDVEIVPFNEPEQVSATTSAPRIFPAAIWEGIAPSLAYYPIFPRQTSAQPSEKIPAIMLQPSIPGREDSGGGSLQITHDTLGLHFIFDALGHHRGEVIDGESMWRGDSVQLAIDLNRNERAHGSTSPWYEIGFAYLPSGKVGIHAWRTGQDPDFDYASIAAETTATRTTTGYRISTTIPWHVLKTDPRHPPPLLGINVVFNSEGVGGRRQAAEWTSGIAFEKSPASFASAVLETDNPESRKSAFFLRLDKSVSDEAESISGIFIEYAKSPLPATLLALNASSSGGDDITSVIGKTTLPAIVAGGARSVVFSTGPKQLKQQGTWRISAHAAAHSSEPPNAQAILQRVNMSERLSDLIKTTRNHYERLAPLPLADSYSVASHEIIGYFLRHIPGSTVANFTQKEKDWAFLQMEEIKGILGSIESNNKPRKSSSPLATNDKKSSPDHISGKRPYAVGIRDGIFVANAPGSTEAQPVFFNGYGHFDAVVRDISFLRNIGANLIQQERGPSSLHSDGRPGPGVDSIQKTLQLAAENGVMVDLLLSPHYFPSHLYAANPGLLLRSADSKGFIRFNIDHPRARRVIEQWLKTIVPLVKDSPALFGFCISNEPAYVFSGKDEHSRTQWVSWLREKHGSIQRLNEIYETSWHDFSEVPVPDLTLPEDLPRRRAFYDWIRFNQQSFANWHRWMAGIIREMAPNVPLHAKLMPVMFEPARLVDGIDAELFADFTDIAGNDASSYFDSRDGYAFRWQRQQMWYDLLHSFRAQPVFNSENHFIPDGYPARHVPPAHTQAIIWQGGMHHQWATALWVWDEPRTPALSGSIRLRPANTHAAAITMLDMNRLAPELALINQAPADVALLYSMPSTFWNPNYINALTSAYTALTFMGKKVTFITERQLAQDQRSPANAHIRNIILPNVTHVDPAAVIGLKSFVESGGKLIAIGSNALAFDDYAQPQHESKTMQRSLIQIEGNLPDERLMQALGANFPHSTSAFLRSANATNDAISWGIEYRIISTSNGTLVPMMNMLSETQAVMIPIGGIALDLISGQIIDQQSVTLPPMVPFLIRIR